MLTLQNSVITCTLVATGVILGTLECILVINSCLFLQIRIKIKCPLVIEACRELLCLQGGNLLDTALEVYTLVTSCLPTICVHFKMSIFSVTRNGLPGMSIAWQLPGDSFSSPFCRVACFRVWDIILLVHRQSMHISDQCPGRILGIIVRDSSPTGCMLISFRFSLLNWSIMFIKGKKLVSC